MATPSTRQAIVQAILKRRTSENYQKEKKSLKGYIPSYLEGDEKCVVCTDKATGYHYKCITCEGCKGFFRRTVQKNLETSYQCKHSSRCDINKVTRNQCQLCRYNKCISVGMAKDLVLDEEKRVAKRRLIEQNRELRRHKELSQMMAQCGWRIERPNDEERRLIHDVTQAYFQANDAQNKSILRIPNGASAADRFSTALTAAITNVVDFAKKIPLFVNHISTNDQVLILKVCCMEVITLRCVASYKTMTKQVTLFPTVDVTKEQLRFTRLEPFSESLFALAEHMESMDLSPVEIALLQTVIIFTSDRPGISERVRLDHAQNTVIRAFEHHLNELWPHDPQYCPSLLLKLNDVRTVSACLAETLMSMRMDNPEELGRLFQTHLFSHSLPGNIQNFSAQPGLGAFQRFSNTLCNGGAPASPREVKSSASGDVHRHVVRSLSQPQLNGYPLPALTQPKINGYHNWKNGKLVDLLDRGPSASFTSNFDACGTSASSVPSSSGDELRHGGNSVPGVSGFNVMHRFPSDFQHTELKDRPTYETFRNSHNKVFQRIVNPRLPFQESCAGDHPPSSSLSVAQKSIYRERCGSLPSSPKKGWKNFKIAPFLDTQRNSDNRTLIHGEPLCPSLSFRPQPVSPQQSAIQNSQIPESFRQRTANDVSECTPTPQNILATGILRMGLPMLLPYVTSAAPPEYGMVMPSIPTSSNNDKCITQNNGTHPQLIKNGGRSSGHLSVVTSGLPVSSAASNAVNFSRSVVHDLTASDDEGDNNEKHGTSRRNTRSDATSPSKTNEHSSIATKRANTSPILPPSKLKCVSPEAHYIDSHENKHCLTGNKSIANDNFCNKYSEAVASPAKKRTTFRNEGSVKAAAFARGRLQEHFCEIFESVRPNSC